jgi:tRNA(Ile)-lysidine synthase
VNQLAERVGGHIRRQGLLKAGDRAGVAVSGGIDSVALLRLLLELRGELGIVLSVVHFNHKLRGAESEADQEFVASLAREHDLEFFVDGDDVAQLATQERISVEAAARELRYGFFRYLLGEGRQGAPHGPNPHSLTELDGAAERRALSNTAVNDTVEDVPFPGCSRGPEGPLVHRGGERSSRCLDKIVTGHTLDDQAETVLMRLIRGSGLRGMAGIYERIPVEAEDGELSGEIARPLLAFRRRELEAYLNDCKQPWREDSTNASDHFTRNRVRKLVVPLLEKEFNPAVAENLAELAEIARGEQDYWENEVAGWMGTAVHWFEPEWARKARAGATYVQIGATASAECSLAGSNSSQTPSEPDLKSRIDTARWAVMNASVDRLWLLSEPVAVQRRLIKAIGDEAGIPLEFKHVEEVLRFVAEEHASEKQLSLPLGWTVMREPDQLVFMTPDLREQAEPQDYEYELLVPGQTEIPEAGVAFEALRIPAAETGPWNQDQLLDGESLSGSGSGQLRVRNWRPGDRFWPAHTKSPKKIKELLQELHIPQPERRLWPVVVSADEVVWMRGFPVAASFRAQAGRDAIRIAEKPLGERN